MKVIENKLTSIPLTEEKNASYSDLIALLVNKPLEGGVSLQDMRRDFKILDKLDANTQTLEFTDDEISYIKGLVSSAKFPIRHKDLILFEDDICR